MTSINDLADRPPAPIAADEVYDLGGERVRNIDTPHVPHGWDAHVLFEEATATLFCGDLPKHLGDGPAVSHSTTCSTPPAIRGHFRCNLSHTRHRADDPSPRGARADNTGHHARLVVHRRSQQGTPRAGRRLRTLWPRAVPLHENESGVVG